MDFSERLLTLRKSLDLTQEQLAEKLNVSFGVTTDSLLKPSEMTELSVKTELLEKQQQQMLVRERKRSHIIRCIAYSIGVYLLFTAAYFVGHFYFAIWNPSVIFAEFLIATAIVIFICVKGMGKEE